MDNKTNIKITNHARKRAQERMGWDKKQLKIVASEAVTEGVYALHDETMREIMYKTCKYNGGIPYLYKGAVFVFVEDRLITVYTITGAGCGELF